MRRNTLAFSKLSPWLLKNISTFDKVGHSRQVSGKIRTWTRACVLNIDVVSLFSPPYFLVIWQQKDIQVSPFRSLFLSLSLSFLHSSLSHTIFTGCFLFCPSISLPSPFPPFLSIYLSVYCVSNCLSIKQYISSNTNGTQFTFMLIYIF